MEGDDGAEDGEWDRGEDDDRRAPGAEHQQHDEADQQGGDDHFMHHISDGIPDEFRGIADETHLHIGRHDLRDAWEHFFDSIHDVDGRSLTALHDDDDDGLFAVDQHGVRLYPASQANRSDVAQMDEGVTISLDRDVVKLFNLQRGCVRQDKPVGLLDLHVPARQHEILSLDRLMHVLRGEVTGHQFLLIDIDHDLHVLAPVGMRQDRTGYRDEHGSNSHDAEIIELRRCQLLGVDL